MDDLSDIHKFYNDGWGREADQLVHRQLEADMTWHYLDWYLRAQGGILD